MKLKDQVALVTGGSRGIGRGIVTAFAEEGAKVAIVYRGSQESAEEAARQVTDNGGEAICVQCDVADRASVESCVGKVKEQWGGRIDILVNNAGVIRDELFIRMEPENWDAVLTTNLGGACNF